MYSDYTFDDPYFESYGRIFNGSRKKFYKDGSGLAKLYKASYSTLKASGGNDIICVKTNSDHAVVQGGAGDDYITNYSGSEYCSFYGEKGDDEFRICREGTYADGGDGNDTFRIWGETAAGIVEDVTCAGGDGEDVFVYSAGKDVIYGFENNDMLKITGTFSGTYNKSKNEVYFKVGSTANAITLKDFTATTFNVNGTNYKISGSKLK